MSKRQKISAIDFHFYSSSIIPATQEAYKDSYGHEIRKKEGAYLHTFKESLIKDLNSQL